LITPLFLIIAFLISMPPLFFAFRHADDDFHIASRLLLISLYAAATPHYAIITLLTPFL